MLAAFFLIAGMKHAFTPRLIMPLSESCAQINATSLSCADAESIGLSFPIASGYPLYYGNFTVSQTDYANVSEPIDLSGSRCIAGNEPSWCAVTLRPIAFTEGNGIKNASITLRLSSTLYPEVSYNYTLNLTVYHYLTAHEKTVLHIYNSTLSSFTGYENTYNYICGTYSICNSSIGITLANVSAYMHNATLCASNSLIECAYYNASLANLTLMNSAEHISLFISNANTIINNNVQAGDTVLLAEANYTSSYALLSNCTAGSTPYSGYFGGRIASALNYTSPVTPEGSLLYLNFSRNLSASLNSAISNCSKKNAAGILPAKGLRLPRISLGFISAMAGSSDLPYIVSAVALLALILYMRARINAAREINMIRKGSDKKGESEIVAEAGAEAKNPDPDSDTVIEVTTNTQKPEKEDNA